MSLAPAVEAPVVVVETPFAVVEKPPAAIEALPEIAKWPKQGVILDRLSKRWCRSLGRCEAKTFYGGDCSEMLTIHHVSKRGILVNRWEPDNLKCVCDYHHQMIEADPKYEKVWIRAMWPNLLDWLAWRENNVKVMNYVALLKKWRNRARHRRTS